MTLDTRVRKLESRPRGRVPGCVPVLTDEPDGSIRVSRRDAPDEIFADVAAAESAGVLTPGEERIHVSYSPTPIPPDADALECDS